MLFRSEEPCGVPNKPVWFQSVVLMLQQIFLCLGCKVGGENAIHFRSQRTIDLTGDPASGDILQDKD